MGIVDIKGEACNIREGDGKLQYQILEERMVKCSTGCEQGIGQPDRGCQIGNNDT